MSFGKKFEEFQKRMAKKLGKEENKKELTIDKKELTIDRMHIVNAVSQYLVSNSLWDDGKEITNIQFSDLFGASVQEFCKMRIFYKKGGAK